ncbi:Putative cell envelope opacity-associated proteinA [Salmonella enterica subsp. arizonae]|uniref:Cell envelope opacity-associated proteinA n=1 Tax=Salmonella enterica subsp. arizonae TaxID=59203 RepID=A0A379TN53_SALER|nr:Putative cell envelope opacity-associated proteinA [Salmonella enterica subsp. arizonae]
MCLSSTREAQLDLQSSSRAPDEAQIQAQLVAPQNAPDQAAPVAPEPIQEGQPEEQSQPQTQPFQQDSGIGQQWRSYRVESGKTLAQTVPRSRTAPDRRLCNGAGRRRWKAVE